jgi:hypothetical protein
MHDALTGEDLAGGRLAAQPRREVQGSASVTLLHRNRFARIQPDPHRKRTIWTPPRFFQEARLKIDGRTDRLTRGAEDREGLVAPNLDHGSTPGFYVLASDLLEPLRELGGGFIASLLGEEGVSADIGDHEGTDRLGTVV